MKKQDFEVPLKQLLSDKPEVPAKLEAAIFAQAEGLLAQRRELLASREADTLRSAQVRTRRFLSIRQSAARVIELFAIHPDAPATAAVFAVLLATFLVLHGPSERPSKLTYSDLPALSKTNDVPARYEAQRLAERQAYEREVENVHRETSGGI